MAWKVDGVTVPGTKSESWSSLTLLGPMAVFRLFAVECFCPDPASLLDLLCPDPATFLDLLFPEPMHTPSISRMQYKGRPVRKCPQLKPMISK